MEMILYRGDNIYNELTNPKNYRFDGLRSKAFGRGDPSYINRMGIIESIRQHINPKTENDNKFYSKTDFISFSKNIERSMFWLKNKNTIEIIECKNEYQATRFLFIMEIPDIKLIELAMGVYSFEFKCNPNLKIANSDNNIFSLALPLMYGFKDCHICNATFPIHKIILIDTVKYLKANIKDEKFAGALKSAIYDEEWLILPYDIMEKQGSIKYASIPRADFWTVKHYIEI